MLSFASMIRNIRSQQQPKGLRRELIDCLPTRVFSDEDAAAATAASADEEALLAKRKAGSGDGSSSPSPSHGGVGSGGGGGGGGGGGPSEEAKKTEAEKVAEETRRDLRECPICLVDYEVGDELRTLPCFHAFHKDCIDKWLEGSTLCPICKTDVTVAF